MKRLLIIALVLSGMTVMAQRNGMGDRKEGMKNLTTEELATLQTKKMTLALDLDETQQTKIKALFVVNAEKRKAKMEERKVRKESGTKPTEEEKYAMLNERLDAQIAQKKEMKVVLTEEQYAKWEELQQERGKNRKGKEKRNSKR